MTNNDVLYMKGMNLLESEQELEEDDEDIWDDRKLNNAYDKAIKIANAEVAKRIAMSTNTQTKDLEDNKRNSNEMSRSQTSRPVQKKPSTQWKVGMHCRAVYQGDGIEYEATLLRIINDQECIVKFIGYDNTEIIAISALNQSQGKTERARQVEDAAQERGTDDECSEGSAINLAKMDCDRPFSVASSDAAKKKKKSSKKKKSRQKPMPNFTLPDLPMPDISKLRNWGSMDMPIPPPPPALPSMDGEEQTISSMLLSWYMSGYYTGLYQGMRRAKSHRN